MFSVLIREMPTIIVLDISLSMAQNTLVPDLGESTTCLQLAVHGINGLLDYLTHYCKLEFVSLVRKYVSFKEWF